MISLKIFKKKGEKVIPNAVTDIQKVEVLLEPELAERVRQFVKEVKTWKESKFMYAFRPRPLAPNSEADRLEKEAWKANMPRVTTFIRSDGELLQVLHFLVERKVRGTGVYSRLPKSLLEEYLLWKRSRPILFDCEKDYGERQIKRWEEKKPSLKMAYDTEALYSLLKGVSL